MFERPNEAVRAAPSGHANDLAMARAANAGDDAAVEELVRTTQSPLWRFCRHQLGNDDDAYDATQDTYLQALTSLGTYRGESTFLTWLMAIARRVCSKQIRARVRVRQHETPEIDVGREDFDPTLQIALDKLPRDLREALILTQVVGLSYEETAVAMECAVGTVRSRVFRARQRLIGTWA